MEELLPGLWHWTAWHPNIEARVHSYYYEPAGLLIDPMLPDEGLAWFERRERPPRRVLLTNRLHYRHSGEFRRAFGAEILCQRAGLHEFAAEDGVKGFEHGTRLDPRAPALAVGALCPEETAFALAGGILALGDAVIRERGALSFVPDAYMGDDPEAVKAGLRRSLSRIAQRPFVALLLAHGEPLVGTGREALRAFLGLSERTRRARPSPGSRPAAGGRTARRRRGASRARARASASRPRAG